MYLHVCPWWLASTLNNPLRRLLHNPERILGDYIAKGATVMDIGCGSGYFTIPMAKMVGRSGSVIAVDIQQKMLEMVMRCAGRESLQSHIEPHQCTSEKIGIRKQIDFALAFYMVHEIPNMSALFNELTTIIKKDAYFLLVEPKIHVTLAKFKKTISHANEAGLMEYSAPKIRMSRAILLKRS